MNTVLASTGCELIRHTEDVDPLNSFMWDEGYRRSLIEELAEVAKDFFKANLPEIEIEESVLLEEIEAFFACYRRKPAGRNAGGSGFGNFFWVFLCLRAVKPRLMVESGVWKGQTTWFIEQAAPRAEIHGFDVDLGYVDRSLYRRAQFHEQDWSTFDFGETPAQPAVAFFDCHVNHARRILEAVERGFRYLLFDDDLPVDRLYLDGSPGVPTAHMLAHMTDPPASALTFVWKNEAVSATIDPEEFERARSLIRHHAVLPGVGQLTGYGRDSHLSLVILNAP